MKKIAFVADIFRDQYLGGGESNDSVLINHLTSQNIPIDKIQCATVTDKILSQYDTFILGNFTQLPEYFKQELHQKKYIIYEHDHKYVRTRDPSVFCDFVVPPDQLINQDFYRNAHGVVVLSDICKTVMESNLQIANVYNIGCSLWEESKLNYIQSLMGVAKTREYAILKSRNPVKGYYQAAEYCKKNNIPFDDIEPCGEKELLAQLAQYKVLVFFPQVLETFCRLAAEAKMLNCKLLTKKKMLGFASEECFTLSGEELLADLISRRGRAYELFMALLQEE